MSRKWRNTKRNELRAMQRKEEQKKQDTMTMNAIKYLLLAFASTFIFSAVSYIWQEFAYRFVTPQAPDSHTLFLGVGLLISSRYWKKCHNNINPKHVILRWYSLLFWIASCFAGVCFLVWGAGAMLGL